MSKDMCASLGTAEQIDNLNNVIVLYKEQNWSLIRLLEEVQEIYGYLPRPVIEYVSQKTDIPTSKIYSVVTFYAQFSLAPKGKYSISVCLGTACYVKGSEKIYEKICHILNIKAGQCTKDGLFSIDQTRCVGCCGMAPVVTINDDVYGHVKLSEVAYILAKYKGEK